MYLLSLYPGSFKNVPVKATGFERYADQLQSGILPLQPALRETQSNQNINLK